MSSINDVFINALLSDACYAPGLVDDLKGDLLKDALQASMTPTLAKFISDNFEVASHIESSDFTPAFGSGFDATAWRGRAGTAYEGKIYVSIQGSFGLQDWLADAKLATTGNAGQQVIDMVNWWLAIAQTGPVTQYQYVKDSVSEEWFWSQYTVQGKGKISQAELARGVEVNGHSLGGYLAAAFTRLLGTQANVLHTTTFNSAGFASGSEAAFTELQSIVGAAMGTPTFPGPGSLSQTNVFAVNGINVATNTWWNEQQGHRVEVFNEEGTGFANHRMYKLTDALALGNAFAALDSTFTTAKLNPLIKAGSNQPAASIEGAFDALRRLLLGAPIGVTAPGDAGDSSPSRVAYYASLKELTDSGIFGALAGKVTIQAVGSSIAVQAKARVGFEDTAALLALSPFVISAAGAGGTAALDSLWSSAAWANQYQDWLDDKASLGAGQPAGNFTDQYITDRAMLLQAVLARNNGDINDTIITSLAAPGDRAIVFRYSDVGGTDSTLLFRQGPNQPLQLVTFDNELAHSIAGTEDIRLGDRLYGGGGNDTISGLAGSDYLEGNADADSLLGGAGADTLLGGAGDDSLDGGADSDQLNGGAGTDTYVFDGTWGKDTVTDSDGLGQITIGGQALGTFKGAGTRGGYAFDMGGGQYAGLALVKDASSSTGYKAIIVKGTDTANTITLNNFDLAKAQGAGWLGIKIDGIKVALLAEPTNFWADPNASLDSLAGKSGTLAEGGGISLAISLSQGAKAGDAITLALGGLSGKGLKAVFGDSTVDADGAVITLVEGQTQVNFALVQTGGLDADAIGALSVTFQGEGQSATSNTWGLTLQDAGDPTATFTGDFAKKKTEDNHYVIGPDGNYVADGDQLNAPDLITGTADADKIQGLGGDDALLGKAGNDSIEGGDGNDVLQGGLGADTLDGGAGSDVIYGSSDGSLEYPTDPNAPQPPPASGEIIAQGLNWRRVVTGSDQDGAPDVTLTLTVARDQQANDQGNVIDGGAGDDNIYAGTGDDLAHGGEGSDVIVGMAGNDVLLADAGDDWVYGDGPASDLSLPVIVTPADQHGSDFLDGGDGNDRLYGQGNNDEVYGGAGDDVLYGDDNIAERTPESVHGNDYLDGEDGNDTLSGGGRDDTLYGGAGDDSLDGDGGLGDLTFSGNDYLDGELGNDTLLGSGGQDTLYGGEGDDLLAGDATNVDGQYHGADYLDGEEGADTLIGGGKDDTLYGGDGSDLLRGDDRGDLLAGTFHGADYLDGEAGNDTLIGGGGADTLLGGDGDDVLAGDDDLTLLAASLHGDDMLDGGNGNDRLIGGGGNDQLAGGAGDDTLVGDAGDAAVAVNGNDILDGGDGADALLGNGGNDQLSGGAGDDTLLGGAGDDYLDGGTGVNYLLGGAGNDTLVGGAADYLEGGAGDDTYIVSGDGTSIPLIYDSQGRNTLILDGSAQEYTPYVSGGMTFLVSGGQAAVAFADGTDLGRISVADGADGKTVLQLAQDADPTGRIHSAGFVNGQWVSTSQINTNQILQAGSTGVALDGGLGDDQLDGGIGDDSLAGGAGNDLLIGGAGADVIDGGAGNDILIGGSLEAADDGVDMYQFDAGDGADRIEASASAGDGVARDVITFGQGIDSASVRFVRGESSAASAQSDLVITYGNGDTVTLAPGAFQQIAEIRFADGSRLSRVEVLQLLAQDAGPAPSAPVARGDGRSSTSLLLVGGSSADQLTGGAADDTLVGGAGSDVLAGGQGRNVYVFSGDSGADQIIPSAPDGQEQVLQFTEADLADLRVFVDGQDVVVQQASGAFVRIRNLGSDQQNPDDWKVLDRAGQQNSISQLLVSNAPPVPVTLEERRADFMARQYIQLGSMPQRLFTDGDGHWIPIVPTSVSVVDQTFGHFLETNDPYQITTTYESTPIYQTVTRHSPDTPAKFISLDSLGGTGVGVQLPPGAQPVFGPGPGGGIGEVGSGTLLGYQVPGAAAHDVQTQLLVGWTSTPVEQLTFAPSDSATQFVFTGSSEDAGVDYSGAQTVAGLPMLFRGSITMGAGNQSVTLGSGTTWGNGDLVGDWRPSFVGEGFYFGDQAGFDIDHGLGAWIDMGDGDDFVFGSDANDFIIGGAGNDDMDGQAGADTYYVSFLPGDVDHIRDSARFPPSILQDVLDDGRQLGPANDDTVEFDSTVVASSLSYRFDGPIQLFTNGQHFLDINAVGTVDEGTVGIEWIKFADGTRVALADLLDSIPFREATAPELTTPIESQHGLVGDQLSLAVGSHFVDAQGDALTFRAKLEDGSALPEFMNFDGITGVLSALPQARDLGMYSVRVLATDSDGMSADAVFAFDVAARPVGENLGPHSLADGLMGDQHVTPGQSWTFAMPDGVLVDAPGDTLTYTFTNLSDGSALPAWLNFDAATRTFSGTPGEEDAGLVPIEVRATDQLGSVGLDYIFVSVSHGVWQTGSGVLTGSPFGDDRLIATASNTQLIGGAGDDYLAADDETRVGVLTDLVFNGGPGNDELVRSYGRNYFQFNLGDGQDNIDWNTISPELFPVDPGDGRFDDWLQFGPSIAPSDITIVDPQNGDLTFVIGDGSDSVNVAAWFYDSSGDGVPGQSVFKIEHVTFADGTEWSAAEVEAILQAGGHVAADNHTPSLMTSIGAQSVSEGQPWTFSVPAGTFSDVDAGDTLTYSATLASGAALPSWVSFDAATRTFSGTPTNGDVGILTLKVTATDAAGAAASSTFALGVANVNDAPVVSQALVAQQASEDQAWSFTVPAGTFTDVDAGDTLTYSATLASGAALPSWLTFNVTTHAFTGTPLNGDVGQLSLKVTGTDSAGAAASSTFALNVANVNDAPVVSQPLVAQQASEDQVWSFTVPADTFADVDAGDTLTHSATLGSGAALPSWMTFDAATRSFSGTPLNGDVGQLSLKVTATDAGGATASSTFLLSIANVNEAPVLSQALVAQQASEDQAWSFTVPAGTFTDVDAGDTLTYSATLASGDVLPSWLAFDATTRVFSGTPTNGDVGILTLKVTATDSAGAAASSTFALGVANVNSAPVVSQALVAQQASEDQVWSCTVPANTFADVDTGDTLTYSATLVSGAALPSWLGFDAATRTFSGTPTNGDVGILTLKVTATDSAGAAASSTFALSIANVNDAPVVSQAIVAQQASEDQAWSFTVPAGTFTDVDAGDTLTYSATLAGGGVLPSWVGFNAATRTFSGTPLNGDVGTLDLKVIAADAAGATASGTFGLTIANVNDAPVVSQALVAQQASEDQVWSFTVPAGTFTDVDMGDTLTYSATLATGAALPSWLTFNAATRTFSGTPLNGDVGQFSLKVTAIDSAGAAASSSFALSVANVNDAPVVSQPLVAQQASEDQVWSFTIPAGTFTDVDAGDTLTYSATLANGAALPAWLSFNATTRTFSGTPLNGDTGSLSLKLTAIDSQGMSANTQFVLTVANVNNAPTVTQTVGSQAATQDQTWTFTIPAGTFADADAGDILTHSAMLATGAALPSWLSFNAATRTFSGTPLNANVGNLSLKVTATDGAGATANVSFDLTVANVNDAPTVVQAIGNQAASEDQAWTFTIPAGTFADVDVGDTLSYGATLADGSALPGWLSFNTATHVFSGTPLDGDIGSLSLKVTSADAAGASVSSTFNLTVANTNDAPVVAQAIDSQFGTEDQAWSFTVPVGTFADVDAGDTLAYTACLASGAALPSWLNFNAATRVFSGTPPNSDVGALNLKVTATDSAGASASTSFSLTIANVNDAPVVAQALGNQGATEDQAWTFTVPAGTFADADAGDILTYSAMLATGAALPSWLSFNAATRTFSGTPHNGEVGSVNLKVVATDIAGASANTTFTLAVANVNDAPTAVGTLSGLTATAGSAMTYTVPAGAFSDIDVGDTLTYSATLASGAALPSWLGFNPGTRTFSGTPGVGDGGDFTVNVAATDTGGLAAYQSVAVHVDVSLTLYGTAGADTLTGGMGNDYLNGLGGGDRMVGGPGDDTYVVDNTADVVVENAGEGVDTVSSSITYTLPGNVEKLVLTGTTNLNGTGNALDNVLTGNTANNKLTGAAGNDTLDGGAGRDTLTGGTGDDNYYVDDVNDSVVELTNEGTDTVFAAIDYTLGNNVENLTLIGTSAVLGTGNGLANVLTGNGGDNTLKGGNGNDTLYGGAGNDTLNGEKDMDSMIGGSGDDQYIVGETGDTVVELAGEGVDTVTAGVTYTLSDNVENLTLSGNNAINGTGNMLDNVLTGNAGNNTLSGGAGNDTLNGAGGVDTLVGGIGNDVYVADGNDVITEYANEGIDLVQTTSSFTLGANFENLTLTGNGQSDGTGNELANVLTGNSGDNSLAGNAGNDFLDGGAGNDTLTGGVGNDTYLMARGYGHDRIVEDDVTAGNTDVAVFGPDIASDQLWFEQSGNDLEVSVIGTSDRFTINNWFRGTQYHVEQFKSSDGKTLLDSQVQNLVNAMASFQPPASGQTTLPPNYQTSLAAVIAANWT